MQRFSESSALDEHRVSWQIARFLSVSVWIKPGDQDLVAAGMVRGIAQMGVVEVPVVSLLLLADRGKSHEIIEVFELGHSIVEIRGGAGAEQAGG